MMIRGICGERDVLMISIVIKVVVVMRVSWYLFTLLFSTTLNLKVNSLSLAQSTLTKFCISLHSFFLNLNRLSG